MSASSKETSTGVTEESSNILFEARSLGVNEKASSAGVTEKILRRSGRVQSKPHHYSDYDCNMQSHVQQKKVQIKFCKGNEARALALHMCQIKTKKWIAERRNVKNIFAFLKLRVSRRVLRNLGRKPRKGHTRKQNS